MAWPSEQTIDTVIGGALTFAGGFAGILYVRHLAKQDAEKRFKAAVEIVIDELGANEVNIENLIAKRTPDLEVYDATYRSVELVLASRLRPKDRQVVAEAYAPVRSRWAAHNRKSVMNWDAVKSVEIVTPNKERLSAALEKIVGAQVALAGYLATGPAWSRARRLQGSVLCRLGLHDHPQAGICGRCGKTLEARR